MSAVQAKRTVRDRMEGTPGEELPDYDPDISYTIFTPNQKYAGVAHKVEFSGGRADLHPYAEEDEEGNLVEMPWPSPEMRNERLEQLRWFHNQGYRVVPLKTRIPMAKAKE